VNIVSLMRYTVAFAAIALCVVTAIAALVPDSVALATAAFLALFIVNQMFVTALVTERQREAPSGLQSLVATTARLVTWTGAFVGTIAISAVASFNGILWAFLVSAAASALVAASIWFKLRISDGEG
jgi:predicted MFS family arabinose efflux permease